MSFKLYTLDGNFVDEINFVPNRFTGFAEYPDKTIAWYVNGDFHRLEGPAVIGCNGTKKWLINGKCHRLDGPAVIWYDGLAEWHVHGKRHRLNGPAVESPSGNKEWWIDDKKITELQHKLLYDLMKLKGLL